MSQNMITTTTSFNVSSDDSLNKLPLSSNQSTNSGSDNNMTTTSDSNHSSTLYTSPICPTNNMVFDQQSSPLKSTPKPSSYSPNSYSFEITTNNVPNGNHLSTDGDQQNLDLVKTNSLKQPKDHSDNNSAIYTTHSPITSQVQQTFVSGQSLYSTSNYSATTDNGSSAVISSVNGSSPSSNPTYHTIINSKTFSPKSKSTVQSFHSSKQTLNQRYSITNFDTKSMPNSIMTINIKGMLLDGVASEEIVHNWLTSIKCEEYLRNFIDNGYDMSLITKMTPQDLTAIGCKSPAIRKKLLLEIKKLNLEDDIPDSRPSGLNQWLELLKLGIYYVRLCDEGYDTIDKVCELTWEDLEEIGIVKLGHQKRLLLGIEKIKKFDKMHEERQNDYAVYDIHPNHRVSLNQYSSDNRLSTLGRSTLRSGFFQKRSGTNLDHRGLPVATVMPALKHVNSSLANLDLSNQTLSRLDATKNTSFMKNGLGNNRLSTNGSNNSAPHSKTVQEQSYKMSDLSATIKRTPPPLPPVRTNSLRIIQDSTINRNNINNNSIYANNNGTPLNGSEASYGPTSFLRTPKLGTLTATTNKMLTSGGHIQTLNGQSAPIRTMMPVREAPPPPPPIPEEESAPMPRNSFNLPLENDPLIGHQLASADEFPPPPPSQ